MEFLGVFGLFGVAAFCFSISYSSLPGKVKSLERKMKLLASDNNEEKNMSKLLEELIGKKCTFGTDFVGAVGVVLAVDEEWVKIEVQQSKKKTSVKLIPIDSISSIDIRED